MAGENTVSTLNGLFKEVYAQGIAKLVPDGCKLQKDVKFVSRQAELGNKYHQPVLLSYEHGFTHAGASAGAFTLNSAVASTLKDATLEGTQILLRAQMDYESAARASKGRNAFVDATGLMFESMEKSMRKRVEAELWYGQSGIGVVSSISSNTITLAAPQFAPGIWAGAEGMTIDIYDATLQTRRGSAAMVITAVDIVNKTVTVDSAANGITGTDIVFFGGAKGNEAAGVHKILTNTGSLFGIDAAAYSLWKTKSYAAGSAALTQAKIGAAIAQAVGQGLDGKLKLYVNPKTWNNLLADQAALRRFTDSKTKMSVDNGSQEIKFFNVNGETEIVPSIYVWEGFAFGLQDGDWIRPGSADVTFQTPGMGEQIFLQLPTAAGFEVRSYYNGALFCEAPAKQLLISGVVNS